MTGTEIVVRASLQDKLAYADKLAQSGLLPAAYRRQPANVLYATEYGEMLGLLPLAAINGLHIIEGKPTASSGMVSALVRRAGHRLRSGYDATTRTGWCEIVRADDPEFTYRAEWTLQRAVDASLVQIKDGRPFARDKEGRPKPWERYPEAMLKARAITECARDACEEALNGVRYTPEELGAEVDETGEPIRVTAVRADQVPATEPTAAPPAAAPVNWDAELATAAGDYEALRALWSRAAAAQPDNSDLLARIMEAGKAAKATTEQDEPVDAEIVEEPRGTGPAADTPPPPAAAAAEPTPSAETRPELITQRMLTKLHTQLTKLAVLGDTDKHRTVSLLLGRQITSTKQLTKPEGLGVIDVLDRCLTDPEPVKALDALLDALHSELTPTPDDNPWADAPPIGQPSTETGTP